MTINKVELIDIPRFLDDRGNLSFFQNDAQIPFKIERVYWIYDVPGGAHRGGHSYFNLQEVIIALSGSFDVVVDDGNESKIFTLNRSYNALYIPKMIWRRLENFSTNAVALIAASEKYNESDYIRDYNHFQKCSTEI